MLENVYEGLNARKCNGRSNQKVQKTKSIYFPKWISPKYFFAKCTRLACLLSFASLFCLKSSGLATIINVILFEVLLYAGSKQVFLGMAESWTFDWLLIDFHGWAKFVMDNLFWKIKGEKKQHERVIASTGFLKRLHIDCNRFSTVCCYFLTILWTMMKPVAPSGTSDEQCPEYKKMVPCTCREKNRWETFSP